MGMGIGMGMGMGLATEHEREHEHEHERERWPIGTGMGIGMGMGVGMGPNVNHLFVHFNESQALQRGRHRVAIQRGQVVHLNGRDVRRSNAFDSFSILLTTNPRVYIETLFRLPATVRHDRGVIKPQSSQGARRPNAAAVPRVLLRFVRSKGQHQQNVKPSVSHRVRDRSKV